MQSVTEYLDSKRIDYKLKGKEAILTCPTCSREKLSVNIDTEVYQCWYCQAVNPTSITAKGHISQLKELLGDILPLSPISGIPKLESSVDFSTLVDAYYKAIWDQPNALKYLKKVRGFGKDIIKQAKLGYAVKSVEVDGQWIKHEWISIPVYKKGIPVLIKYRQIPPENENLDKYIREKGGESTLYNIDAIDKYDEIFVTEGELDALTLIHNGYPNTVGMTAGAGSLLPEWYDKLVLKSKIYLILDPDEVGQKAAKNVWSARLGSHRCVNIVLPIPEGEKKEDVNSYFFTHTKEDFANLVVKSSNLPVEGLISLDSAFQEMYNKSRGGVEDLFETPWERVNTYIGGGCRRGELVVLGAPAGTGKTTMAVQYLHHLAFKHKKPIFMLCLEMPVTQLITKVVQISFKIPYEEIDYSHAYVYGNMLGELPMHFGYSPGISMNKFVDTCRVARDRFGCEVICLDNLQFMVRSKEESEYGNATKIFKNLALELNIVFLLISQPRKMLEGEVITYDTLKGTSAIGQDADTVILLQRKRLTNGDGADSFSKQTTVIVDKARFSSGGRTNLFYEGRMATFYDDKDGKI